MKTCKRKYFGSHTNTNESPEDVYSSIRSFFFFFCISSPYEQLCHLQLQFATEDVDDMALLIQIIHLLGFCSLFTGAVMWFSLLFLEWQSANWLRNWDPLIWHIEHEKTHRFHHIHRMVLITLVCSPTQFISLISNFNALDSKTKLDNW